MHRFSAPTAISDPPSDDLTVSVEGWQTCDELTPSGAGTYEATVAAGPGGWNVTVRVPAEGCVIERARAPRPRFAPFGETPYLPLVDTRRMMFVADEAGSETPAAPLSEACGSGRSRTAQLVGVATAGVIGVGLFCGRRRVGIPAGRQMVA